MNLFTMLPIILLFTPASAHGRVDVMRGNLGGNTTGLGILGASVPLTGPSNITQVDTTIFSSLPPLSAGLGRTRFGKNNTLDKLTSAMTLSGNLLPQISVDGTGFVEGIVHIVTVDGAGPFAAVLDTTGTGAFEKGVLLNITIQVPGIEGRLLPKNDRGDNLQRSVPSAHQPLEKRASNVNEDYPIKALIPAGTICTGKVAGFEGICLVKIVNPSKNGPFGGVVAVQMVGSSRGAVAGKSQQKAGCDGITDSATTDSERRKRTEFRS